MKMRILIAALLVVALATPVMAFNVEWHGDFNNRFMWSDQATLAGNAKVSGEGYANSYYNSLFDYDHATGLANGGTVPEFKKDSNDSDFLGEVKYRMWLTAQDDDKKVKGTVAFEFGGAEFGDNAKLDYGGDKNIFELRWAYTDFELPGDAATRAYVGLMPVGYNKFLWNDNAAGVKLVRKSGDFTYSAGWFRDDVSNGGQGSATKMGNDDAYGFDLTWGAKDMPRVNGFVLYLEKGKETDKFGTTFMDQQMFYGAAIDGQAGPLFYGATFIKEDGEMDAQQVGAFAPVGRTSLDRDAWLANLEGTVKVDKARIKLGWLYSTGDDDPTDSTLENFNNIDAYMGGFGSVVVFDSFADDNTMVTGPYIMDKGLNMVYAGVDFDMTDKASVGASYLWINAAEDMDFGANKLAPLAASYYDFSKEIGHEFSVRGSYKITKNLSAGIEVGYLVAGDGLDAMTELNKDIAAGALVGESADDVLRTDASIRLKF